MALKDTYYTISEAARKFGITRQTISRWVADDELPAEKVGRETLIKKVELKRYMDERRMMKTASQIVDSITERVREKYNYTDKDRVEFPKFDRRKAVFRFSITRKDKTHEIVTVSMGNPVAIENKNKSILYFGFKIPIKKIERSISNK